MCHQDQQNLSCRCNLKIAQMQSKMTVWNRSVTYLLSTIVANGVASIAKIQQNKFWSRSDNKKVIWVKKPRIFTLIVIFKKVSLENVKKFDSNLQYFLNFFGDICFFQSIAN